MCIRYVVSYPRLSRMTRRKGTDYLRFCALDAGAAFLVGALAAPRRAAAALALSGRAVGTGPGADGRAAGSGRAGVAGLAARTGCGSRARTGFGSGATRGRGSGCAGAARWIGVNRI